jgi:hypothetical protein
MADDNSDSRVDPADKLRGVLRGMLNKLGYAPSEAVESINGAIEELADELNAEAAAISIERVPCEGCGMPTPALLAPADYQRDGSPDSYCKSCVEGHAAENDRENDGHGPKGVAGGGPLPFLELGENGGAGDDEAADHADSLTVVCDRWETDQIESDYKRELEISDATITVENKLGSPGTPNITISGEKTPKERVEDLKDRLRRRGLDE